MNSCTNRVVSSHPELASNINRGFEFENLIEIKTLGVSWKSQEDCFVFKITVELKDSHTKRCVLSTIARLFDPLGLLGPVVAKVSEKTFLKEQEKLSDAWEKTALKEMEAAVSEEKSLAIQRRDVDSEGIPLLTVVVDGSWAKRSYKTNYASLSGVIETLPVTSKQLRQETAKDEELGPLLRALGEGQNLQGREAQYTIEDGCILYGQRVCIPKRYQKNVLDELHAGHLGIVGDKVAVRVYRAANSKWTFGKIVNRDGALHYTIEVQGTLVRRHVDQIRPVGDQVQETDQIPNIRHKFSASDVRESDPNIQHAETAENPTPQVPSEERDFSPRSTEPSTDIRAQDSPVSDAQPKNPSIQHFIILWIMHDICTTEFPR
ncbi:unnamed protein product [Larinioides sclopetarius]|uniref:Mutator-like transposase domain-containing protein n=1 Tax=Larinioides sclopetarius TaxID=280406 RepID=A0AAV2AA13_9ARAC